MMRTRGVERGSASSEPLLIYVVTELYPSLFKPYFDTQFGQFVRDGHRVRVFAFATGEYAMPPLDDPLLARIYAETRYLPSGRGTLPRHALLAAWNTAAAPRRRLAAIRRARAARPPRIESITDVARLLAMPLEQPDLCLVHNLIAARWVRFLRDLYPGAPVAFYYHGGELPGVPEVSADQAEKAFAAADIVFTNTAQSKAHAVGRGCPAEKVHVSPVGFNLAEFPQAHGREYRHGNLLQLLSIGRLSPEKGFNFAIEAARQLVESGFRDFHYRILGGGPMFESLDRQIRSAHLEDFIELAGPVPRAEVLRATAEADVLILPSIVVGTWEENQACVVQEAMLSNAVVVATRTGGVPESLAPELRRLLVPEGDAKAIAAAIRQVAGLDARELARLGQAGRQFAEDHYDIRALNQQLLETALGRPVAGPGPGHA